MFGKKRVVSSSDRVVEYASRSESLRVGKRVVKERSRMLKMLKDL